MTSSPLKRARRASSRLDLELDIAQQSDDEGEACIEGCTQLPIKQHWPHLDVPLLDGPTSYKEIAEGDWASHLLKQADIFGDADSIIDNFTENLLSGLSVTTSFSGMGCPELACFILAREAKLYGCPAEPIKFHGACDQNALCQHVLTSIAGDHGPSHVFGDLLQELSPEHVRTMICHQDSARASVEKAFADAPICEQTAEFRKALIGIHTAEFLRKVSKLAKSWSFNRSKRSRCYRCGASHLCQRWPRKNRALHIELAGTICVAFSSIGLGWAWLDPSAIACVAWATMMKAIEPDVIIHECVPAFDVETLHSMLGPKYAMQTLVFSPISLGVPSERPRRYTVFHHLTSTCSTVPFDTFHFSKYCYRRLVCDGNIYFVTKESELSKAKKGSAPQHIDDPMPWRDCMSRSNRDRLEEHCTLLEADGRSLNGNTFMVNYCQNAGRGGTPSSLISTLCVHTHIWRVVFRHGVGGGFVIWHGSNVRSCT